MMADIMIWALGVALLAAVGTVVWSVIMTEWRHKR